MAEAQPHQKSYIHKFNNSALPNKVQNCQELDSDVSIIFSALI